MTRDPRSIVAGFLAAESARDYALARTFLADQGFYYASPISVFRSADDYIQYLSFASGIVQERLVRKVFVDGGDVCHFITYRIQISEKQSVEVAHWARVREGRIERIEMLFDASNYRQLFEAPCPD